MKKNNDVWRAKYKRYFPHLYSKKNVQPNVDWQVAFHEADDLYFSRLGPLEKELFTLVQKCDLEGLKKKNLTADKLMHTDDSSLMMVGCSSLAHWAGRIGDQPTLDYFYNLIKAAYMDLSEQLANWITWIYSTAPSCLYGKVFSCG